jgi:hypothetical protein
MYNYQQHRHYVLTDDGQRHFIKVRDRVLKLVEETGAITMGCASRLPPGVGAADSFHSMVCVDRMVELGDLQEIFYKCERYMGRVFVKG